MGSFRSIDETQSGTDDDGRETRRGYIVKRTDEYVQGKDNQQRGEETGQRSRYVASGLESGGGERGGGRVRRKEDTQEVCHTDRNEFLIRVDLVVVQTTESWRVTP